MKLGDVVPYLIDFGVDVLVTVLDTATGVLVAQLGDSASNTPDSDNAEWWQQAGFASRPALPTPGGVSCQALVIRRGDRDMVFATRDTRGTGIYGNLADGEAAVYAPGAQGRLMLKADGSVSRQTTDDNTATGNAVFDMLAPTGRRFYAPFGGDWFDATGWHMRIWQPGSPSPNTGASLDFGPIGLPSLPSPFGSITPKSMGVIACDVLKLDVSMLLLGKDTGLASGGVQATQLQVVLSAAASAISAVENLLSILCATVAVSGDDPATSNPLVTPALAAASSAVATATTALGTITTACQARTSLA